ncbi:MAG TPA: SpoIID/LytB domain-containing protein [Acidimicrobiales bacterium]|nr:SpoIID/LytB domain-containing protein [Acidimicrobiales bacterium]
MGRILLGALVALGVGAAITPAPTAIAAVPVVVVDGEGWGHGVGMAQDGAFWMATDGASMDGILDHFYPGAGRGSHTGTVRVVVHVADDSVAALTFPDGGEVRSPRTGPQRRGFPVRVPAGGAVTIAHGPDGYRVHASGTVGAASVAAAQPVDLPLPSTTSSTSTSSTTSTTAGLLPGLTSTTAPEESTSTTAPPPTGEPAPVPAPSGPPAATSPEPVWAGPVTGGGTVGVPARGLRYRGELEVSAATGVLRVVNDLDVEQYLWGLAEVGASFPLAAVQAQVVAARTYALRAMAANGEICDTQRCQVYKGASAEFPRQVEAVNTTLGTTLTWGRALASAVYSANAAGVSATPREGFGTPDEAHPYLVATTYPTRSPDPWEVRIGLADLAVRLGYPGTAVTARVSSTGPSGRPLEVELDGDAGPARYPALEADAAMGLRSTRWALRIEVADEAPPPPDADQAIQAPPDRVGAAVAAETAAATSRRRATTTTLAASAPAGDDGAGRDRGPARLLVLPVLAAGAAGLIALARTRH